MTFNHPGLFCLITGASLGLAITPFVIRAARALGLVDQPGVRKVHKIAVPRIGGLAIALATILPFMLLAVFETRTVTASGEFGPILTLIAVSLCGLLLGLIDDLANIPAKYKLLVLVGAAAMFCASGSVIHGFIFHGRMLWQFGLASWPITILWVVGLAVSINFLDGLDGLASGIVAIAAGVLAFCAYSAGNPTLAILPLGLVGALLGFLYFNFNPARIFMGDCGSMFIGFVLAGSCVIAQSKIGTTRGILLPSLALSIPILDTMFTFVRRGVLQRRSLFSAERGHIHHRLLDVGLCHRHVVILLLSVTLLGGGVSLISLFGNTLVTGLTAIGYLGGLVALVRLAGTVRARETITAMRRNRALGRETKRYRVAFEELQLTFSDMRTFSAWWGQLCKAAEMLNFARMDLPLVRRDGSKTVLRWRHQEISDANSISAEIPVPQRRSAQNLRIDVAVIVGEFLETAGQRLALFSRLIGECNPQHLPDPSAVTSEAGGLLDELFPNPVFAESAARALAVANPLHGLRVALVHDFLYCYAGAERVLEQLVSMFPQADLFSLFDFLPEHLRGFIRNKPVKTTFIQRMPLARRNHRLYLPLMPLAIEQLDLSEYDVVISSSYVVAKGVMTRPDQLHICYCHTPVRYAWDLQNQYLGKPRGLVAGVKNVLARVLLHYIRNWDVRSSNNVDAFVANSDFVGRRIEKIYRRSAMIVHPPVDTDWFKLVEKKEDFYVTASRLVSYKRIDLAVDAFARLPDRHLFVIGDGPELENLRFKAPANVHFLGYQSPQRLRQYLQRARAFVFGAEEDFGIAPVEAQACGTPVIAFGRGGATESVIPNVTGVLFDAQTPESLVKAIQTFESRTWNPIEIRKNAERFSIHKFREKFGNIARTQWKGLQTRTPLSSRPQSTDCLTAPEAQTPKTEETQTLADQALNGLASA